MKESAGGSQYMSTMTMAEKDNLDSPPVLIIDSKLSNSNTNRLHGNNISNSTLPQSARVK